MSSLVQLIGAILLVLGAVLPVVNPLGDAPLFLALTAGCDRSTRAELARRIAFYSFLLLLGAMLLGSLILRLFGLSNSVVLVAGGVVVCGMAWKLLADRPKPADVTVDPLQARAVALGRVITPLTLPLTIDGGALSVAVTVGASHAHTVQDTVMQFLAAAIAAAIIALSIFLTYRYAQQVVERIGHTGVMVLQRLSAFIMLCIGVSILWNGIKSLLVTVGFPPTP
ncbi:MAG: MarC family protein [Lacunisphaera sp.]